MRIAAVDDGDYSIVPKPEEFSALIEQQGIYYTHKHTHTQTYICAIALISTQLCMHVCVCVYQRACELGLLELSLPPVRRTIAWLAVS